MADQRTSQIIGEVATLNIGEQRTSQIIGEVSTINSGLSWFDVPDTPIDLLDPTVPINDYNPFGGGTVTPGSYNEEPMIWSMDLSRRKNTAKQHFPCGHWHTVRPVTVPPITYPPTAGRWIYPEGQYGTDYIYVLEIDPAGLIAPNLPNVVKIDMSTSPPTAVETLRLTTEYTGYFPRTFFTWYTIQAGPSCMNKSGTRIFYILRDYDSGGPNTLTANVELVEIDITGTYMEVVKITKFTDLVSSSSDRIMAMCANNHYVFILTEDKKLIKVSAEAHIKVSEITLSIMPGYMDIDKSWNRIFLALEISTYTSEYQRYNENLELEHITIYRRCGFIRAVDGYLVESTLYQGLPDINPVSICNCKWEWPIAGTKFTISGNGDYIQYVFSIRDSKLYMLNMANDIGATTRLYCVDTSAMTSLGYVDITYYCGTEYGKSYDWNSSTMTAQAQSNLRLAHFRYKENTVHTGPEGANKNWLVCFSGDSNFDLLSDSAIEYPSVSHY